MTNVIIENLVQIVATLIVTLIGVLGAWLTAKIAKRAELSNISTATDEAIRAAQTTVLELQQTTVDKLKAASADGKLTKAEIAELGKMLIDGSMEKMSDAAKNVLNSAGVDITAIIKGAGRGSHRVDEGKEVITEAEIGWSSALAEILNSALRVCWYRAFMPACAKLSNPALRI